MYTSPFVSTSLAWSLVPRALAGKPLRWDIIKPLPSVGVVLYHRDLDAWLLVRQFRPAVYATARREAAEAGQPQPSVAEGKQASTTVWAGGLRSCPVPSAVCNAHTPGQ